jgi:hypothetical protein
MAHCSRQSLYQAIKTLADQGAVIQRYGYLEVANIDELRRFYRAEQLRSK